MSEKTEARDQIVLDLAREFFDAVLKGKDWRTFAQLGARKKKAAPNMPTFLSCKILRTKNPGSGRDPDQMRIVQLEITIGGTENMKHQLVSAEIMAVRETGWDPCSKCDGLGQTDPEPVCSGCRGTGKIELQPPRMPEREALRLNTMMQVQFGVFVQLLSGSLLDCESW